MFNDRSRTKLMKPDFTQYTYFELLDALKNIDRETYPDRVDVIRKELDSIKNRFPFLGAPSDGFHKEDDSKSFLDKVFSVFSKDKPIKHYGGVDAYVSDFPAGKLHASSVSAYMIEDDEMLHFILRGYYQDGDGSSEVRLKLNAAGLKRLKEVVEQAELDIRKSSLSNDSQ